MPRSRRARSRLGAASRRTPRSRARSTSTESVARRRLGRRCARVVSIVVPPVAIACAEGVPRRAYGARRARAAWRRASSGAAPKCFNGNRQYAPWRAAARWPSITCSPAGSAEGTIRDGLQQLAADVRDDLQLERIAHEAQRGIDHLGRLGRQFVLRERVVLVVQRAVGSPEPLPDSTSSARALAGVLLRAHSPRPSRGLPHTAGLTPFPRGKHARVAHGETARRWHCASSRARAAASLDGLSSRAPQVPRGAALVPERFHWCKRRARMPVSFKRRPPR